VWEELADVHYIILRGNGKAFCAGGDIKGMYVCMRVYIIIITIIIIIIIIIIINNNNN